MLDEEDVYCPYALISLGIGLVIGIMSVGAMFTCIVMECNYSVHIMAICLSIMTPTTLGPMLLITYRAVFPK